MEVPSKQINNSFESNKNKCYLFPLLYSLGLCFFALPFPGHFVTGDPNLACRWGITESGLSKTAPPTAALTPVTFCCLQGAREESLHLLRRFYKASRSDRHTHTTPFRRNTRAHKYRQLQSPSVSWIATN